MVAIWYTSAMIEKINSLCELKKLSTSEVEALATDIRQVLIDTVAETGGHLASNLGAVELTLALHRVFDSPRDKIIFDVGHQSYTHKLLTGRADTIRTLRGEGGLSGFPKREESEHDIFETGHASTAISAALGLSRARDALGERHAVVALVGDGALTGGLCYEALNDAGSKPTQIIVLLNDNEMSIAQNVGALSHYLTKLRGSSRWIGTKSIVKKGLHRIPLAGARIANIVEKVKRTLKLMLVPGEFFEALGLQYLGPIDGHDVAMLEHALRDARDMQKPVVVHAVTQKGRGYAMAEHRPEAFHGVAPFFVENGKTKETAKEDMVSASKVVGEALVALAENDPRVTAITAAMPQGTGLALFAEKFPDRFFDVGIAEEHAVTLAAGMAAGGLRPVFAVYASFLQRSMDELLHDVCLQGLDVLVLADHAGFVAGDGATHQGVYDLGMLRIMPGLKVWAPCDACELREMLAVAGSLSGPCVIRYPKGLPERLAKGAFEGRWRCIHWGERAAIIAHGQAVQTALEVADKLRGERIHCAVWNASIIMPLDSRALAEIAGRYQWIVTLEEEQVSGGLGAAVAVHFAAQRERPHVLTLGVPGIAPGAHSLEGLARACGIDAERAAAAIREALYG